MQRDHSRCAFHRSLPGLAWLLSSVDWPEQRRLMVVLAAAAGYLLLAALVVARVSR
jgi:hypothetical protein